MRIWSKRCICLFLVLAGAFGASTLDAASCFSAPNGLVGWWAGDGNALTLVGTNNGTLLGGATATNAGMVGAAFTFDGTNSVVQIVDSQVIHQTNFTIEAWVRFTGLDSAGLGGSPAGDQYIIFKQNSRNSDFEGIDISKTRIGGSDYFRFLISSPTGQFAEMESATAISTNVWYHIAAVRGSNFTQLYVNGVLERQTNVAFAQDYGTLPLFFGTSGQTFWDHKFKGTLDEVSLYNRVLSAAEISAIYSASNSGKCKTVNITAQPVSQALSTGSNAQFNVAATGLAPLTYQWRFNNIDIPAATNSSLTLTNIQLSNGGNYVVVVSNSLSAATSSVAVLSLFLPPAITTQPSSRTNIAGTDASFSAAATGTPPPGYQWQFNGANIAGATTANLTVSGVQPVNAGNYAVVVTNVAGSVTSSVALLTVWLPPSLGTQPSSRTNITGTTATFIANAAGTAPLSYQWLVNGANLSGANGSSLTLNNVQPSDGGNYTVVVTNVAGAVTSAIATLTILVPPSIIAPPSSRTNITGTSATFNVSATGTAPLTYQWQFNGANIAGANNSSFTVNGVQTSDAGNYTVIVTNVAGTVTSATALLTVWVPPTVALQPQSATNIVGTTTNFSVIATGTAPLSYQWLFNGANINGANASSLTLGNVQVSDSGNYSVIITNVAGVATSSVATLTIWVPPSIIAPPSSRTNITGTSATFNVSATGTAPLSYQWQFNGANITGANNSSFTVSSVQTSDAGNYAVVVTNVASAVTSSVAVLTVWVSPAITAQPASQTNIAGTDATFSVIASGTPAPGYQWQFNGVNLAGATSTSLTLNNVQPVNGGAYAVVVTNSAGSLTSTPAVLTIWVPPSISLQPATTTNIAGTAASFSVTASGTPALSYQWQFNGLNIGGATASSLTLNNVQPDDAGGYTVAITNLAGVLTSAVASLTVWVPPSISIPPLSQSVISGSNAAFSVAATGTVPLNYQWQRNGITLLDGGNISGASTATLTITAAQPNNAAAYTVVVTNVAGSIISSPAAVLTVNVPPSITALPQSQTIIAGSNVTLTVSASGTLPLNYQWRLYGTNLASGGNIIGAATPTLTIAAAQTNNAGPYTIVISNVAASLTSSPPAQLTVNVPPSITTQPKSLTVLVGSNVTFTVGASGTLPLSYQWRSNGTSLIEGPNFVGTTTPTLSIPNAQPNQSAAYAVLITNAAASVLSSAANLLVINPDVVVFCDTNLEDAVRLQLNRPTGDVTRLDLINLNFLCAPDSHITCLGGLEWATNLSTLYLGGNLISEFSVLTNLSHLTNLYLYHNLLSDLSPLAKLTNLARLDIRWNPTVSNFSSVAGPPNLNEAYLGSCSLNSLGFLPTLPRLTFLSFDSNPLSNLTPLTTLPNLKGLDLSYNAQADLQQLAALNNLTSLYLSDSAVTNLSFAQNLTQLTNLALRGNALFDASSLAGLPNLGSLNLADNLGITNFSALSSLTNLQSLWLNGNSIADLAFLQPLSRLAALNLDFNLLTSLSPIAPLTNLTVLSAQQNLLTNTTGLSTLTNLLSLALDRNFIVSPTLPQAPNSLRSLSLSSNNLATAESLANLAKLESLNLAANPITDYSAFSGLSSLSTLCLSSNSIGNASFLQPLPALSSIDLHGNHIADLSPLGGLTNLSALNLAGNLAADPSSLAGLVNLHSLDLSANPVANWNFISSLTNLTELYVQSDGLSDLGFAMAAPNLTKLDITFNRITNSTPLIALKKLHYFLAGRNRFAEISSLSALPRLWYVDVRTNLLNISPGSDASSLIGVLTNRLVSVDYLPQNQPPVINLPTVWPIAANVTSSPLAFDVSDDVTASNLLSVSALSSNLSLIPNANISLSLTSSNRTITVTPIAGKTGNTLLTLTVTDETALSTAASVLVTVVTQQNVSIPDLNLRASIRSAIGKSSGALNNIDMLKLLQLTANNGGIGDLTGLEWASNLVSLSLAGNSISNLSRIQNLPSLKRLTLDSNPITDFSQLALLTNLSELSLVGNSITNVTFVNNLTGLSLLNLNNNNISDLSPLTTLTNLTYLFLGQNLVTNISPLLGLTHLVDLDVTLNLLDTSSDSTAMAVISALQLDGAAVFYLPQRSPPGISAPTTWRIPVNAPSYLGFNVFNSTPPTPSLTVTATSSNPSVLPNANLSVFQNPDQSWTLKAIPLNQPGNATVTLNVVDSIGLKASQPVATTVVTPGTLGSQFLNDPNLSWSTWGNAQWFGETTVTHDGVSAAQSGHISDSQESWLSTTVIGPGKLSFWWRVSSEPNFDFLQFYINDALQTNSISGEVDWQQQIFNVPIGVNVLRWRYVKDPDSSLGADAGWLDEVSFAPGVWLELLGPPIAGQAQLILHAIPGNPYEVQVSTNLVDWTRLTLITPTNTATPVIDGGAGSGTRFYRLRDLSLIWFERPTSPAGSIRLVLHSPPNLRLLLLASTNLTDWTTLATVTNTLGTIQITNSLTTNFPRRFYRAQVAL